MLLIEQESKFAVKKRQKEGREHEKGEGEEGEKEQP